MTAVLSPLDEGIQVHIPAWVSDNATFLRWAEANLEGQSGKIGFFQGLVWIDHTMETHFHHQIKMAIAFAVMTWNSQQKLGRYYGDGMLFSKSEIELSSEPDGMFATNDSIATKRVWLEQGRTSLVLFGTPDIVLEVISKSSRKKDTKILPELYHQAGISEYWLVDSLIDSPELIIHRHTPTGYEAVPGQEGWVESKVLRASFQLVIDGDEVRLERKC